MESKNFLFVSLDAALITDVAWQVTREGHDVRYYIGAESDREIGDGFVPKTDDWRAEVEWADVIVFDDIWVWSDVGTGRLAEELRERGTAVVGGTPNTDRPEEDRGYAMEVLEEHGVDTIDHHVFHDFGEAILNCIVDETGIFPFEYTPRFGYPTITLQEESFESPTGEFVEELATGNTPELRVHRGYQVGVRVVLPPFPFTDEKTYDENSRNAAVVFETEDREGVHIEDAKDVGGQWRVAGEKGMPIVVTGKGETMQTARKRCYDRIDDIVIPNMYYRDDIGERWIRGR